MELRGRAHTGCVFVYLSLCLKLQGTSFVDNKITLYTCLHYRNTTIDLILLTTIMTASLLTQSWITKKKYHVINCLITLITGNEATAQVQEHIEA